MLTKSIPWFHSDKLPSIHSRSTRVDCWGNETLHDMNASQKSPSCSHLNSWKVARVDVGFGARLIMHSIGSSFP